MPSAYGTDWLVLMVRDPTWAHAYWDISVARVSGALGSLGGGKAFLRLIGFPAGLLLAEYEVSAERGRQDITLPEADRSYVAEFALVHYGRKAILARSEVVHAPASVPPPRSAPTFVGRAQQRRALASGLGRRSARSRAVRVDSPVGPRTLAALGRFADLDGVRGAAVSLRLVVAPFIGGNYVSPRRIATRRCVCRPATASL